MAKKKSRLMTANQIKSWLQPKVSAFGERHRMAARIRLANSWATRHPKRTFGYVVGTLLMVLFCDIAIAGLRAENSMENMSQIAKSLYSTVSASFRQTKTISERLFLK